MGFSHPSINIWHHLLDAQFIENVLTKNGSRSHPCTKGTFIYILLFLNLRHLFSYSWGLLSF